MKKDEIMDEELTGMVSYTDLFETAPAGMPWMEPKPKAKKTAAIDAEYVLPPNPQRGTMDRLKSMAMWLGICGGICMLLWAFEVNDLMAFEAAYPCIFVSGCIGCAGAGRSSKK